MIVKYHGKDYSIEFLRASVPVSEAGISLLALSEVAGSIGMKTLAVRISYDDLLSKITLPCIVHRKSKHFIVVYKIKKNNIYVTDPSCGFMKYRKGEFIKNWINKNNGKGKEGICLLLEPSSEFFQRKKQSRKNTNKIKILSPYLKPHFKKAFLASIFMILLSLLALPTPYLMKYIIDEVLIAKNIKLLNLIIILLIAIQLLKLIFSFLTNYLFSVFNQEIIVKIKKDLFHRLLRLPLSFFDKTQTGYLLSRIGEVEGLSFFFSNTFVRILIGLFEFIFCLIVLFYLNWRLTFISISILPLFYFATKYYSKSIRKLSKEVMEKGAILSHKVQDSLSGVEVIKTFTSEERETEKIHYYLDVLKQTSIKRNIVFTLSSELLSLIGVAGGFLVLWWSGIGIIKGTFTIGTYIAFSAYLAKLFGPTQMIATIGLHFQPAVTALERVRELMEYEAEEDKGIKINKVQGEIEFKDVYFTYNSKREEVLKGINLRISPKEKILITGPNGSGKSTLIKLLLGLYKAKRGKILIDKKDINQLSLTSLRERVSIVSQNTFLFNDTVRNNILYSCPDASEEKLIEAVKLSGAYEFIKRLDKRFDTVIGERGVRLSGGEHQKLSIARAILKDSDIIIFDEATTHLDRDSEKRIQKLINENFKNKTCIIISHKIWNIPGLKIYFMNSGKIFKN
jgi:ABC-type bacteriocin/lantibiotic exporter with double-glycine peptidase domain